MALVRRHPCGFNSSGTIFTPSSVTLTELSQLQTDRLTAFHSSIKLFAYMKEIANWVKLQKRQYFGLIIMQLELCGALCYILR